MGIERFQITIAFFGAFLSRKSGTKGVVEKLSGTLQQTPGVDVQLISRHALPFVRAIQMLFHAITGRFEVAHLDVYSGRSFYLSALCAGILKKRKIPFVVTLRGGRLPEFYTGQANMLHRLIRAAQSAQTPSLYLRHFFEKKGLSLGYLPNPIDLNLFHPQQPAVKRKPWSLLWVRAFDPIYQPLLPVETLYLLRKQFPEARLTMIGPDKGSLAATRRRIAQLGLEGAVDIPGPVPNEILPEYYATHAVFLNTTQYESFGAAVLEAAACEIPIVSTGVGEIPYLWHDEVDIFMAETGSASDFAEKIRLVFEHPEMAAQVAHAARAKAEQFSQEPVLEQWRALLIDPLRKTPHD